VFPRVSACFHLSTQQQNPKRPRLLRKRMCAPV